MDPENFPTNSGGRKMAAFAATPQFHATVDLRQAQTVSEMHLAFKEALQLPSFYGMNWSAWIDCLSDWTTETNGGMTGVVAQDDEDYRIQILGFQQFKAFDPKSARLLIECTNDVNDRMEVAEDVRRLVMTFT
jgi:hypothetical protein